MHETFMHGDMFYSIGARRLLFFEFTLTGKVNLHTFGVSGSFHHSAAMYPVESLEHWKIQLEGNWKYIGNIAQWLGEPKWTA